MTQDDILSRAEKYSSMIAGWCFNSSGLEKFWREAYEAGQKYEREACAQLALQGTGEAVQTRTTDEVFRSVATPLYAHTAPQRKPLTGEEVIEHFQTQVDTGSLMSFVDGVRYAERAHGIGGEA